MGLQIGHTNMLKVGRQKLTQINIYVLTISITIDYFLDNIKFYHFAFLTDR